MAWRDHSLYALPLAIGLAACVTNHDALERRPNGGAGGMAGGVAGGPPTQFGGNGGDATGGGHPDDEPPGSNVLTLVNGIVDAPEVLLCWATVDAEGAATPIGDPLGGAPLSYGHTLVLRDVSEASDGVLQPFVIAGDLGLLDGLDCAAALELAGREEAAAAGNGEGGAAGAPASDVADVAEGVAGEGGAGGAAPDPGTRSRLRARALPAIPAETLGAGRSLVLVANGCLGGATYTSKHAADYCGDDYTPSEPTVSAVLVSLSRAVQFERAGMQVVHASLANPALDVSSVAPLTTSPGFAIASRVVAGQVAPRPATLVNPALAYGVKAGHVVKISSFDHSFDERWTDVLANGGIEALADGNTYALVFNGPRADLPAVEGLWNAPVLTLVAADPPSVVDP